MAQPLVSVILPVYAAQSSWIETVCSALKQSLRDIELIVISDLSTENLHCALGGMQDSRLTVSACDPNAAEAARLNQGLALCRGKYVSIASAGDIWLPEKLEKQIGWLEAHPETAACFTWIKTRPGGDGTLALRQLACNQKNRGQEKWLHDLVLYGNSLYHPTVVYRKSLSDACGKYDESLKCAWDYAFHLQTLRHGDIHVVEEPLIEVNAVPLFQAAQLSAQQEIPAVIAGLISELPLALFADAFQKECAVAPADADTLRLNKGAFLYAYFSDEAIRQQGLDMLRSMPMTPALYQAIHQRMDLHRASLADWNALRVSLPGDSREDVSSTVFFRSDGEYSTNHSVVLKGYITPQPSPHVFINTDVLPLSGCTQIRLYPCEEKNCLVSNVVFSCGRKRITGVPVNCRLLDSRLYCFQRESYIQLDIPQPCRFLHIQMSVTLYSIKDSASETILRQLDRALTASGYSAPSPEETAAFFTRQVVTPARYIASRLKRQITKREFLAVNAKAAKIAVTQGPQEAIDFEKKHWAEKKARTLSVEWPAQTEWAQQRQKAFKKPVKISILVPLYNTPARFLQEMIESVLRQSYADWELCMADGSDAAHAQVREICLRYARKDTRIRYKKLDKNLGISNNTNACFDLATGNYYALLDHDDLLLPSALYEAAEAICEKDADYVYTDEATFRSPNKSRILNIHFKPGFSPDNLLANNYICHFSVFSADLLKKTDGFRSAYDGSQDHELILRLTHAAKCVVHIPKVLYLWRSHPLSVAQDIGAKEYAISAARNAVQDYLRQVRHIEATAESTRAFPNIFRILYPLRNPGAKVSIIVSIGNKAEALHRCVASILQKTSYPNYELLLVANDSFSPETSALCSRLQSHARVKLLADNTESLSMRYSRAAEQAAGEYLVFLRDDTEIITPAWLESLLMYAQREDVGAVGPILYSPSERVLHAGIALEASKGVPFLCTHAGEKRNSIGYMGRLCYAQNVTAVSGACLAVRKALFYQLNGLNEELDTLFAADFCLRLREKGYTNIFTPFAELFCHHPLLPAQEQQSSPDDYSRKCALFRERWKDVLEKGDPYLSPQLRG